MKISVIICFYNRLSLLPACLDSLRNSADHLNEVIIADDGSEEEVVAALRSLVKQYPFPIIHSWHPRQGPRRSAARNNGIRQATGDYLLFLDADFALLPGTIHSHIEAARPGHFASGRCKYTTEEQCQKIVAEGASESLLEAIYTQLPNDPIEKEHRRFVRYSLLRRLRLAPAKKVMFGGHFSAFKKDIEAINGYDENFVGWGGEDLDFALRLVRSGVLGTSVIKTARMLHLWHPSEMVGKHWKEGANMGYFSRRHIPVACENGLAKPASTRSNLIPS
ncbi:MAG: glycosyltransferase [Desulfobacteraceae bacterium]|nr:glycosyltransferase [Desulfobacteraceae bacterium]